MTFKNFMTRLVSQLSGTQPSSPSRLSRSSRRRNSRLSLASETELEQRVLLAAFVVTSGADNTTADSLTTLREAILLANDSPGADTITFGNGSGSGGTNFTDGIADTITLSLSQMSITGPVTITGQSSAHTFINANNASRIFSIQFGAGDTTLQKLSLTGGRTTGGNEGGAIKTLSEGTLTINESMLFGNSTTGDSAEGGAIYSYHGSVTVSNSTISGNSTAGANAHGGAIFAYSRVQSTGGPVVVSNSTISGNSTTGTGSFAGAMWLRGNATVSNSSITDNFTSGASADGGAIRIENGTLGVNQSTFSGNSTSGIDADGGAIATSTINGAVTVSQSTFSENSTTGTSGSSGGAIYGQFVTVSQSTLSGNFTTGTDANGGAIYGLEGTVMVSQSTLTGNRADSSYGGAIGSFSAPATIQNSIVAGNTDYGTAPDVRGPLNSTLTVSNSLIGRNNGTGLTATGLTPGANGNLIGGATDGTKINPLLAPLANNGGPTRTHALLTGSPALNRGSNALAVDVTANGTPALTSDQRGAPVARIANTTVDMGAYELFTLATPIVVSTTVDELDGNISTGDLSLREAIILANSSPGANTITFATSTNGAEFDLSLGQFEISDTVTITGNGVANTIVDAQQNSRIFDIRATAGNVTLSSLMLKNGRTTADYERGGAVRSTSNGILTITQSTLSGNSTTGVGARGGAISTFGSGAVVIGQSTLSGNSTSGSFAYGGAIYAPTAAVTVNGSMLSGNLTTGSTSRGGAIAAFSGVVTVDQSTFLGNRTSGADADGGAIWSNNGDLTVSQSAISVNYTEGINADGGAIYAVNGAVKVRQSSFVQNFTSSTSGASGGAIFTNNGALTVSQSTLSGNVTEGTDASGGAIYAVEGAVMVSQSTLTGNQAKLSSAGAIGSFNAPVTIQNSIVAGNTDDGTAPDVRKSLNNTLTVSNSLIGRNNETGLTATGLTPGANGNLVGGNTDGTKINPLLAPLANNGGPTLTHALLPGSPAFNRGSNALAVDVTQGGNPILTVDQRGSNFLRNVDGTVDMGAIETRTTVGSIGNDAFVLTYSSTSTAGTVSVTVSTNSGPVVNLGTFPMNSPLTIDGLAGTDSVRVVGTASADTIIVNSGTGLTVNGASLILTSIENRTLAGVAGSDVYKFDADTVLGLWTLDEAGGGTDTIDFSLTTTVGLSLHLGVATAQLVHATNLSLNLGASSAFENAVGGSAADRLTGNGLGNTLSGGLGDDILYGGAGSDLLFGGANNDTYLFTTASASEADQVTENTNEGIDTISFAALTTNVALHLGSNLVQTVHTNRTLKLNSPNTFENSIGGSGADSLTGNGASNTLTGGPGVDTLNGGAGSDLLLGGLHNDTYVFTTATAAEADQVTENTNEGTDTISFAALTTNVALHLGSNLVQTVHTNRTLKLNSPNTFENSIGGSGADSLTGNGASNTLTGGPGVDTLNGGAGSDLLLGGLHNDTYVFTTATAAEADQVTENTNEGTDTISFAALTTSVALHLGSNLTQTVHTNRTLKLNSPNTFENSIGGSGADSLAGNGASNTLTGGPGVDTLNGGAGSDLLFGGLNNDTYVFTTASVAEADQVTENTNEGTDTLNFSTLTTNVALHLGSNLTQTVHTNRTLKLNSPNTFENSIGGSGADSLTGNGASNTLTGGPGVDTLNGGAGSDLLFGGLHNDTYVFTTATASEADQVTENTNEGIDTISFATQSNAVALNLGLTTVQAIHTNRTLKLNSASTFENATGGSGSDTLIGNALANRLTGGNGDNILVGLDGTDILEAGSGRDILIGGLGLDTLNGGSNDDILIAGRTTSDTSISNLNTLRTEWISGNAYATRIANLRAGVGSPAVSLKATINVLNDAGEDDSLTGGTGTDWYFRAVDDVITDLFAGEIIDVL